MSIPMLVMERAVLGRIFIILGTILDPVWKIYSKERENKSQIVEFLSRSSRSSGKQHREVWQMNNNVSEKLTASTYKVENDLKSHSRYKERIKVYCSRIAWLHRHQRHQELPTWSNSCLEPKNQVPSGAFHHGLWRPVQKGTHGMVLTWDRVYVCFTLLL
jgi:hypothetical protein